MKKRRGFTLVEIAIVVLIIGVLAAVAIPKFTEMIRRSNEGKTKGSLGSFRSAVGIYYSDMAGSYPSTAEGLGADLTDSPGDTFHSDGPFLTKYLEKISEVRLGLPSAHNNTAIVYRQQSAGAGQTTASADDETTNGGAWRYNSSNGAIWVGCTHTDTRASTIGAW